MATKTMGFIGGGRIAQIMLGGFRRAGKMPQQVVVSDPNGEVLQKLQDRFPEIAVTPNDNRSPAEQGLVFLGVHPPAVPGVLSEIKPYLKSGSLLVSLAPKVTIVQIAEDLGGFAKIARTIPNAPSIINAGYNPVAFSPGLTAGEKAEVLNILGILGQCLEVAEQNLEAYAIVTAMGPTYLWFQFYQLQELGESFGLTQKEAAKGIAAMVLGAVKTMYESGLSAPEVMDLIPVKPLGEEETNVKILYREKLGGLFQMLKG
jgi:pyrroline-5-carboxylate reductase